MADPQRFLGDPTEAAKKIPQVQGETNLQRNLMKFYQSPLSNKSSKHFQTSLQRFCALQQTKPERMRMELPGKQKHTWKNAGPTAYTVVFEAQN